MAIVVLPNVDLPTADPLSLWKAMLTEKQTAMNWASSLFKLAQDEVNPQNKAMLSEYANMALVNLFGLTPEGVPNIMGMNKVPISYDRALQQQRTESEHQKYAQELFQDIESEFQQHKQTPQYQIARQNIYNTLKSAGLSEGYIAKELEEFDRQQKAELRYQKYLKLITPNAIPSDDDALQNCSIYGCPITFTTRPVVKQVK